MAAHTEGLTGTFRYCGEVIQWEEKLEGCEWITEFTTIPENLSRTRELLNDDTFLDVLNTEVERTRQATHFEDMLCKP